MLKKSHRDKQKLPAISVHFPDRIKNTKRLWSHHKQLNLWHKTTRRYKNATIISTMDHPCKSRKRQLSMDKSFPATMNAYRLHFSCENIGRYIGSTKRRIRWWVAPCFVFACLGMVNETRLFNRGIPCLRRRRPRPWSLPPILIVHPRLLRGKNTTAPFSKQVGVVLQLCINCDVNCSLHDPTCSRNRICS